MKALSRISILASLSLALLLAVGCTSEHSTKLEQNQKKTLAAETLPKIKKTLLKKSDKTPEDLVMNSMRISLAKSHEIFSEVWAHIWQDRMQRPMSIFSEVGRLIQGHIDPASGHYSLRSIRCNEALPRSSEVVIEKDATGIRSATVYRYDCAKPGNARTELARVQFSKDASKIRAEWSFENENLPRGAGSSMSFLRERSKCVMSLDERDRLELLDCQAVGQNRSSDIHIRFDRMLFKKSGDTMLLVEGKKFKSLTTPFCDEPRFCTQVKVPLIGKIEIFDDLVSQEGRELQARKAREEEHKEAQEALEKRIIEQKKMLAEDSKNQKLKAQRMQMQMDGGGAASGVPGEPFGDSAGQIAPASADYAPSEDQAYEAPASEEEDPAAMMARPDSDAGVYEFNHQNPNQKGPEVGRQAAEGMVR